MPNVIDKSTKNEDLCRCMIGFFKDSNFRSIIFLNKISVIFTFKRMKEIIVALLVVVGLGPLCPARPIQLSIEWKTLLTL